MNNSPSETPIGRQLTLANLPGLVAKRLEVPPGHTGLVVDGKGRTRTLPPGRHKVVGFWRRLLGRVSDWQFAVIPTVPMPLLVPVPHLRSGDGEWMDVTCGLTVRVADPQRFYAQFVRGGSGTTGAALAQRLSAGIEGAVRQAVAGWAAEDLTSGAVNERLAAEVRRALEPLTDSLGLALEGVRYVTVLPVEEAVEVARKQAELEAMLAEVEMERRMSQLSTEAEWQEFVQQLEADYGLPGLTQEAATPIAEEKSPSNAARMRGALRRYADARTAGISARVERLLGKRKPPQPPIVRWWERVVPWLKVIGALILIGSLVVYYFLPIATTADKIAAVVQLLCAVPSALALFVSALWLERKAAQERAEAIPGARLLRLGRGDRERIDQLVRGQLTTELETIARTLRDTRDRAYREGRRDEALAIKQIEERAERLGKEIAAGVSGAAPYLTAARVSRDELETMLNYDEELLAQAGELSDVVETMRQTVLAGEPVPEPARQVEAGLSDLDHRFQVRARFIQAPASPTNQLTNRPTSQLTMEV